MDVMDLHVRLVDQVMCHQHVACVMKATIVEVMEAHLTLMKHVNVSMIIEL